jgi:hypothetical protein
VLRNKAATREQKEHIYEVSTSHGESHTKERKHMHERMEECRKNPDDSLMVYLDGMDQQKTHIPQFTKMDSKDMVVLGMR